MKDSSRKIISQTDLIDSKPIDSILYNKTLRNSSKFNLHPTKPQQMTDEYFKSIINSIDNTNASIVQIFKMLDYNGRIKLQKYCITNFDNLSLFLLYQLGWELGLQNLSSACTQQLINQNYQQLNYSKYDLIKCSYFTFRKILDEYDSLVKSLEIQGLKQSDLKSVIDDYCLMCNVDNKQKENLYNQFVYARQIVINSQAEVRRSMIETSKSKMELSTPLKTKNTMTMAKTPNLISSGIVQKQKNSQVAKIKQEAKNNYSSVNLNQSANLVKIQIQQLKQKQTQLYSELLQTKKQCTDNKNQKFLKQSFSKLERAVKKMEKQLMAQNQKIQKLKKSASDIKSTTSNSKKIDFVFSF